MFIKYNLKDKICEYVYKETRRNPMILAIIMDIRNIQDNKKELNFSSLIIQITLKMGQ